MLMQSGGARLNFRVKIREFVLNKERNINRKRKTVKEKVINDCIYNIYSKPVAYFFKSYL